MTTEGQDTTNATPRPWRAGYLDETDRKERMVIRAEDVDGQPYVAICPAPIVGSHEANATLIVQAVNSHAALVAALTNIVNSDRYKRVFSCTCHSDDFKCFYCQANVALSAAREEHTT